MYNLFVSGRDGTWNGNTYRLDWRRFGEYTEREISQQFDPFDGAAVAKLLSFPTLFAYEKGYEADARIGVLQSIILRSGQLRIDYEFCDDLPPVSAADISRLSWELEIAELEMNRTHWAIKDVDLLLVLRKAGILSEDHLARFPLHPHRPTHRGPSGKMIVAPTVFQLPDQGVELDLVSVMMPFDSSFSPVYESIRGACKDAGLRCLRADNIWEDSTVIQDIFALLVRSHMVVVDFTGRNPNVMYETGITHTLGREVVPIAQSLNDVPFDLRHHRVLKYLPNGEGLVAMRAALADRLRVLRGRTTTKGNP